MKRIHLTPPPLPSAEESVGAGNVGSVSNSGNVICLTFKRYIKFCIVGSSGIAVDMGILYLLASPAMLGWNISFSKVMAAEVAIFNNFLWNDLWTFRGVNANQNQLLKRFSRLLKFNLICVVGIGLSVLLLNLQVYSLHIDLYVAT